MDEEPSPHEVERGVAALVPFVRAWSLPLNPENLDLLAYAVLRHARSSLPLDEVREFCVHRICARVGRRRGHRAVWLRRRGCDTGEVDDGLTTLCPACGFDAGEPPWQGGGGSHEICVSCGLQFGYQDSLARGDPENPFYHGWRSCWLTHGAPWSGHGMKPPPNWDPKEQGSSGCSRSYVPLARSRVDQDLEARRRPRRADEPFALACRPCEPAIVAPCSDQSGATIGLKTGWPVVWPLATE